MGFYMCCAVAVRGGCSRMSFPRGGSSFTISGGGARVESGNGFHEQLRGEVRQALGKQRQPSAAILDSQSVKTTGKGGSRGTMRAKQVKGRKRHIVVDTLGFRAGRSRHGRPNVSDPAGAKLVLDDFRHRFSRLRLILGRQRLRRHVDRVGQRIAALAQGPLGDCQTVGAPGGLCGAAAPLDCGTDLWMVQSLPPLE